MEEDIKIVESLIKDTKESIKNNIETLSENRIVNRIRAYQALENLLKAYKELKEKYNYEKNRARTELDTVYINARYDERDKWKSKVKEKIKELQEYNNKIDNEMVICTNIMKMQVLQELLEEE